MPVRRASRQHRKLFAVHRTCQEIHKYFTFHFEDITNDWVFIKKPKWWLCRFSSSASGFVWSCCSNRFCSLSLPCALWPSLVWIPLLAHPIILPRSTSAQLMRPPWKLIQKIDRPSGDSHLLTKRLNEFYFQVERQVTGAEVATGGLRCTGEEMWVDTVALLPCLSLTGQSVTGEVGGYRQTDRQTG